MAHSPRGWTGARTPSAIKRVRQAERRRAVNQPRRSAAKTLSAKALLTASNGAAPEEVQEALAGAMSALDLAAKKGAIHPNAADRRKSRLALKINAAVGGETLAATAKAARSTGKAAAAKQAKARIAASRATKAKGAQTAAGKARAALARSTREATGGGAQAAQEPTPPSTPAKSRATGGTRRSGTTAPKASTGEAPKARATRAKKS